MKIKRSSFLLSLFLLFVTGLACSRGAQNRSYNHAEFRFHYPAGWQTMSDLWETHRLEEDFYGLGA